MSGIIIQRIIYTSIPGNAALSIDIRTKATRTIVGSQPKCSAIPAQTPAIILSDERVKRRVIYLKLAFSP